MNDEILKLARECGAVDIDHKPMRHIFTSDQLEAFYKQAFNAGRSAAIAEMEKAEPVAWVAPDGKVSTTKGVVFRIPLYTHPAPAVPEGEK